MCQSVLRTCQRGDYSSDFLHHRLAAIALAHGATRLLPRGPRGSGDFGPSAGFGYSSPPHPTKPQDVGGGGGVLVGAHVLPYHLQPKVSHLCEPTKSPLAVVGTTPQHPGNGRPQDNCLPASMDCLAKNSPRAGTSSRQYCSGTASSSRASGRMFNRLKYSPSSAPTSF